MLGCFFDKTMSIVLRQVITVLMLALLLLAALIFLGILGYHVILARAKSSSSKEGVEMVASEARIHLTTL